MKAMILAAGRGERLRPLTDKTPKPLIKVAGKALIEYHLNNLAKAGFNDIVINTAWLADKIHAELGNGSNYGLTIHYSDEGKALETAGGIIKALPLLGDEPFLVVNGDIWSDFNFSNLPALNKNMQAHLVLVKNPEHNKKGDFALQNGRIKNTGETLYTFSGIGLYRADFFSGQQSTEQQPAIAPLAPIIRKKCEYNLVSGQLYDGLWTDIGTIERLQELERQLG
ncbi:nucleotidyltransferase family protein [Cardiobacterium sp. AH-315-I02]|nr:nucleotidyltransferase family protein [Cardiobacterium sp. AH-315-I02]